METTIIYSECNESCLPPDPADPSVSALAEALLRRGWRCAVAESCTGGLIGAWLTGLPGASRWFAGGVIAYSNEVKARLLAVPPALLERVGAVSGPVALAMARGACAATGAQAAAAVSGVAGPDGGSADKPVGTVWIGVCAGGAGAAFHYMLTQPDGGAATRAAIRATTARLAVERLTAAVNASRGTS